jgi:hypothetical protein
MTIRYFKCSECGNEFNFMLIFNVKHCPILTCEGKLEFKELESKNG